MNKKISKIYQEGKKKFRLFVIWEGGKEATVGEKLLKFTNYGDGIYSFEGDNVLGGWQPHGEYHIGDMFVFKKDKSHDYFSIRCISIEYPEDEKKTKFYIYYLKNNE